MRRSNNRTKRKEERRDKMIFNLKVFRKLIKEAYNGIGLAVGKDGTEYFLEGGTWVMRIKEKAFAKEYKGAVIELVGDLPEAGEVLRATKDNVQYELPFNSVWRMESIDQAKIPVYQTNTYLEHKGTMCRVMQGQNNRCMVMTATLEAVVDASALDEEIDTHIEGPNQIRDIYSALYWQNSTCSFMALTRDEVLSGTEQDILNKLSEMDMREVG